MKRENLDVILYELMQAENLGKDEEEVVGVISLFDGGLHTLLCC